MFIRTKTVKGRDYYYLVENQRNGSKIKQTVLKYLGRSKPSSFEELGATPAEQEKHQARCPHREECAAFYEMRHPLPCTSEIANDLEECPHYSPTRFKALD